MNQELKIGSGIPLMCTYAVYFGIWNKNGSSGITTKLISSYP